MTIADMLGQSGVLTVMGMGTVFGFLAILIICVTLMGKVIQAFGADKTGQGAAATGGAKPAAASGANSAAKTAAVTAAITAAVNEYRKNENR
jgi:oxaloacetate decarboxylase gamma subunit